MLDPVAEKSRIVAERAATPRAVVVASLENILSNERWLRVNELLS